MRRRDLPPAVLHARAAGLHRMRRSQGPLELPGEGGALPPCGAGWRPARRRAADGQPLALMDISEDDSIDVWFEEEEDLATYYDNEEYDCGIDSDDDE